MRRTEKEIVEKNIIEEILAKSEICRIAMIDNNEPYLVPLNYGYCDNNIYFHSALNGRKIEILKRNNKVCFEVEYHSEIIKDQIPCKWSTKYRSVIGYGKIEIITDVKEKRRGLDIIMSKYGMSGALEYNEGSLQRMVILKLSIEQVSGKQSGTWN
jgi:uncharacterized protein